ncbi:alpha/beta fold hydrolase [Antarcticimicrobium luteum]|uniref:Alpha/beta hydrolase n=1 Tax=Antarcticimicrobium luteum TaxID=2547397 RepID=A0A4R5UQU0_9RHOB|nr:alpha/beta hydrolase [Antarcticimicrobium luteum]TDK41295.1 alpha/beta hydrolase [Antarcticimicrobium luteum]
MDGQGLPQPVFARQFGHGPRQVLAIHCTLAHSGAWRGIAAQLEAEATFTAFDMLGHGRSPDWDGQGDVQDRMTEIGESFLTERMDVIGHSFGATVALRLAAAHPDRVRSLTMVEPVYFCFAMQDDPEALALHEADTAAFTGPLERGEYETGARLFNELWGGAGVSWDDMPEAARAGMVRSIRFVPACRPSLYDDLAGILGPDRIARVSMPALLLRGTVSHPVTRAINDAIARRLPDARNVVIEGAGHMLPITHPAEVASHLRALFEWAGE